MRENNMMSNNNLLSDKNLDNYGFVTFKQLLEVVTTKTNLEPSFFLYEEKDYEREKSIIPNNGLIINNNNTFNRVYGPIKDNHFREGCVYAMLITSSDPNYIFQEILKNKSLKPLDSLRVAKVGETSKTYYERLGSYNAGKNRNTKTASRTNVAINQSKLNSNYNIITIGFQVEPSVCLKNPLLKGDVGYNSNYIGLLYKSPESEILKSLPPLPMCVQK